jgi:hypothetical protein
MKLISTIIFSLFSLSIFAQDTTQTKNKNELSFTFYFGRQSIQFPNLRNKLESLGYEKPSSDVINLGYGLKFEQPRLFGGIDISLLTGGNSFYSFPKNFLLQGYFNFQVFDNGTIAIAPGIDLGLQKIQLDLKRTNASNNFDTLFLSGGNYVKLTNLTPVGGISTIIHFKNLDKSKNIFLRLLAHIRLGYKYGLQSNQWKADDNSIINSPSDRLSSFYVQLLFGF